MKNVIRQITKTVNLFVYLLISATALVPVLYVLDRINIIPTELAIKYFSLYTVSFITLAVGTVVGLVFVGLPLVVILFIAHKYKGKEV